MPSPSEYRLAELEYRALLAELSSGTEPTFQNVGGDSMATVRPHAPQLSPHGPDLFGLPTLNVPLGQIAVSDEPAALSVVGILIPDAALKDLRAELVSLFGEHHRAPFGRLLFVCEALNLIPLLGRYGFAYHRIAPGSLGRDCAMLNARFGMRELRALKDGKVIWAAGDIASA